MRSMMMSSNYAYKVSLDFGLSVEVCFPCSNNIWGDSMGVMNPKEGSPDIRIALSGSSYMVQSLTDNGEAFFDYVISRT